MKTPVQVYFPSDEAKRLKAWARKRGKPVSEVVRDAVRGAIAREEQDPLFSLMGVVEGGPADGSVNHEQYNVEAEIAKAEAQHRESQAVRRRGRVDRAPGPKRRAS